MPETDIYFIMGFVTALFAFIGLVFVWKFITKSDDKKEKSKEDRDDSELPYLVELYKENAELLKTYIEFVGENSPTAYSCRATLEFINKYVNIKYSNMIMPIIRMNNTPSNEKRNLGV